MPVSEVDEALQRSAVCYVKRHSMHQEAWQYTLLGQPHAALRGCINPEELVIASSYMNSSSWYVFTTRQVISLFNDQLMSMPAERIFGSDFGNFKGVDECGRAGVRRTETATLVNVETGELLRLEFETLYASMAPIYTCKFWERRRQLSVRPREP